MSSEEMILTFNLTAYLPVLRVAQPARDQPIRSLSHLQLVTISMLPSLSKDLRAPLRLHATRGF